jgi:hypothetical protein
MSQRVTDEAEFLQLRQMSQIRQRQIKKEAFGIFPEGL